MVYDEEQGQAKRPPIMVRAAITADEWAEIRKRAIDARLSNAEYVASLLRKGLEHDGR